MCVYVTQSCPNLCDSMDCSVPGSSVYEILQARILERVAISFSRGSSWPRDWTQVSHIAGRFFIVWATQEAQNVLREINKYIYIYFIYLFLVAFCMLVIGRKKTIWFCYSWPDSFNHLVSVLFLGSMDASSHCFHSRFIPCTQQVFHKHLLGQYMQMI